MRMVFLWWSLQGIKEEDWFVNFPAKEIVNVVLLKKKDLIVVFLEHEKSTNNNRRGWKVVDRSKKK
jgi:hypothetical protein